MRQFFVVSTLLQWIRGKWDKQQRETETYVQEEREFKSCEMESLEVNLHARYQSLQIKP